jgi:hypothetical protein
MRVPYSSLYYLSEGIADIMSYSALTHGDIEAMGLTDTIRVVEEEKE